MFLSGFKTSGEMKQAGPTFCQRVDEYELFPPSVSSGRHSRQDSSSSSSSRDSGVYSTGGGSSLRRPNDDQTSQQGGPCDPGQLKMCDMAPELRGVATDEGIGDVSV